MNSLKQVRESKGFSLYRLARLVKTSPRQIQLLETDKRKLTVEWAKRLANALDCTPADILGYDNLGINENSDTNNEPVFKLRIYPQEFACGDGAEPLTYEDATTVTLTKSVLHQLVGIASNNIIGVKAKGLSMLPEIKNNDIVFIDTGNIEIINNDIYAFRFDSRLQIKKLTLNKESNTITAESLNPDYPGFIIDLTKNHDFQIIGKVIGKIGKI